MKYLLDTNAYFAVLRYLSENESNEQIERIIRRKCYISKITQIEIISVIGQYARGQARQTPACERVHADTNEVCNALYVVEKRKKWSGKKIHDWLKLEREISNGINTLFQVEVLEANSNVLNEAEMFIQKALVHNFKSMDSMILGTAMAYSTEEERLIIVTADKGLKAGLKSIGYPFESFV